MSVYTRATVIIKVKGPMDEVYELIEDITRKYGGNLEMYSNCTDIDRVTDSWVHKYEKVT